MRTGPITPMGSGSGSPIKQYDELAQTFRESPSASGAEKRKAMKDANPRSKNKMSHAIHIRIENNGSPDAEDRKTRDPGDSILGSNAQRPGSQGANYGNQPMHLKKTMHTSSREMMEVYHNPDLSGIASKKRLMMARKNSYAASPTRVDRVELSNDFDQ